MMSPCLFLLVLLLHFSRIYVVLHLRQVKAGHLGSVVMTKTEREINADLLRQQTRLAAGK